LVVAQYGKANALSASCDSLLASLAAQPLLAQHTVRNQTTNETVSFDATTFAKTFTHRTASVNGIRLHYVIGGRGDAVVLLHGWPETWYTWRKVMPTLAQHYTVIAPDLPGLGDSEKPEGGYDMRTVAEVIHGLVGKLGYNRIFLVGHDVGTWIAYSYAAAHPNSVTRLVIMDAALPGVTPEQASELSREANLKTWQFAFNPLPELPEALVAGRERLFLSWFFRNKAANPASISETDINEYIRAYSAPGKMKAGFDYYRAVYDNIAQNKEYAKTKLLMPVLALGGEKAQVPRCSARCSW
jgi:pimeloyl-ACP methyl ester carboxylesterase